jgi:hypothetical protein
MKAYIGRHVEFTGLAEKIDLDPSKGMRGKVVSAVYGIEDGEERMWYITIDFSFWAEYNKAKQEPIWYDKNGEPCIKWHQTDFYPKNHLYSFYYEPSSDYEEELFKMVDVDEAMQRSRELIILIQKLMREGHIKDEWHNLHAQQEIARML